MLAYETDVTKTVDPFAGSYAIESLTNDLEVEIRRLLDVIEEMGGAAAAIETGFQKSEIERSAYDFAREIDRGERIVVGVNRFQIDEHEPYEPLRLDPKIGETQTQALAQLRASRDKGAHESAMAEFAEAVKREANLLPYIKRALQAKATIGEVCDVMRSEWGVYRPSDVF
ncbi:methylmalonyl-CoA mutase [mine drainage metagenome]|uniref:Methylmalonyl-CoA mutase n=1 Tax=mine drainage metagenome TaxID=410659 RepID=A0A1J5QBR2_9ZZZZ